MIKEEILEYWQMSSSKDFTTMENLVKSEDYSWALFIGHLVIEKLIKAYYVKTVGDNPPRTHKLLQLAEKTNLPLSEEQKDDLLLITTFNINARYPDYKQEFYKKCTEVYTKKNMEKIKALRLWLMEQLQKR
ncbi:MAG: HEPN domain-containing protein [bacterium]